MWVCVVNGVQVAKLPFSSMYFNARGRLQDKQTPVKLNMVQRWSISLIDRLDGPFSLEIDYLAAYFDAFHDTTPFWERYWHRPL